MTTSPIGDKLTSSNEMLSLYFNGTMKSVKVINDHKIIILSKNNSYKDSNDLIKLTLKENLFVDNESGNRYVDINGLNHAKLNTSNTICVPEPVNHVSTIGTNVTLSLSKKQQT